VASTWILLIIYQDDARSNTHRTEITLTLPNARWGKLATLGIRISHHGLHSTQSLFRTKTKSSRKGANTAQQHG